MAHLGTASLQILVIIILITFGRCYVPVTPALPESMILNSGELELTYSGCPTYVNSSRFTCTINRHASSKEEVLAFGLYAVVSQSFQIGIPEIDNGRLAYCGKYPRTRKLFDPIDFRVSVNSCMVITINKARTHTHRKFVADVKLHREGRRQQLSGPSRNYIMCSAMMSDSYRIVHLLSQFIALPVCPVAYEGDETTAHEPAEVFVTRRRAAFPITRQPVTVGETTPEPIEDSNKNVRIETDNEDLIYNAAVIVGLTLLGLVCAAGAYLYWHFSCAVMDPEAATSTKHLTTTTGTTGSTFRELEQESQLGSTVESSKHLALEMQSEPQSAATDSAALLRVSADGNEMESSFVKSTVGGRS